MYVEIFVVVHVAYMLCVDIGFFVVYGYMMYTGFRVFGCSCNLHDVCRF